MIEQATVRYVTYVRSAVALRVALTDSHELPKAASIPSRCGEGVKPRPGFDAVRGNPCSTEQSTAAAINI